MGYGDITTRPGLGFKEVDVAFGLEGRFEGTPGRPVHRSGSKRIANGPLGGGLVLDERTGVNGTRFAGEAAGNDAVPSGHRPGHERASGKVGFVESVERIEIRGWQLPEGADAEAEGQIPLHSTCVVDVRTRLTYDDPDTGERIVRDVGRAQWMLRFEGRTVK